MCAVSLSYSCFAIIIHVGEQTKMREAKKREELRNEALLVLEHFERCNLEALIKVTRNTLERIRRRVAPPSSLLYGDAANQRKHDHRPAFKVHLALAIPNVMLKPRLEDIQQYLNAAVQCIIGVHKTVYQWGQTRELPEPTLGSGVQATSSAHLGGAPNQLAAVSAVMHASRTRLADEAQKKHLADLKNFFHSISQHKEVAKLTSLLSTTFSSAKILVDQALEYFKDYQHLWMDEKEESMAKFLQSNPMLSDFEARIRDYEKMESVIKEEIDELPVGTIVLVAGIKFVAIKSYPLFIVLVAGIIKFVAIKLYLLFTLFVILLFPSPEDLKIAMVAETTAWKVLYGRNMNTKYLTLMEQILEQVDDMSKRLSRPIKDLDDVRQGMATQREVREKEIFIESSLGPVEVRYILSTMTYMNVSMKYF